MICKLLFTSSFMAFRFYFEHFQIHSSSNFEVVVWFHTESQEPTPSLPHIKAVIPYERSERTRHRCDKFDMNMMFGRMRSPMQFSIIHLYTCTVFLFAGVRIPLRCNMPAWACERQLNNVYCSTEANWIHGHRIYRLQFKRKRSMMKTRNRKILTADTIRATRRKRELIKKMS